MNPRQAKFVEHYAESQNGTQAAIAAGYSPRTAHVTASRLLKNDKVVAAIATIQTKVIERTAWDVERLIDSFEAIHDKATGADLQRKLDDGDHVKMSDFVKSLDYGAAIRSLENIGKLLGHYVTKTEISVPKPIPHLVAHVDFPYDLSRLPSNERRAILHRLEPALIEHDPG